MELGEGLKKILLVGIGTAAVTAEKSKEILDDLVKKGELTVEQGKVLNQELKHNIKSTVKTAADSVKENAARKNDQEELKATISKLTPEQLAAVKAQIEKMQAESAEKKEEAAEEAETAAEEASPEASEETEAEEAGSEEPAAE
jgi:polyhydroxyalkanoate synthesis regulator phasin